MAINKFFKERKIEPINELDIKKRVEFAYNSALLLLESFQNSKLDYLKILDKLQRMKIVVAETPKNISPVNYSYIEETLYVSDRIDLSIENEFILHEVIHRVQEKKNKSGKLTNFGLCNVLDTKIYGLAINEASIQYLVAKILNNPLEIVQLYNMKIPTISKRYYPMVTNLVEQLVFLLGDELLIDSVLNSNDEFKFNAIDNLGEANYVKIQANFDKILDTKNSVMDSKDENLIMEKCVCIRNLYLETQELILKSYFNNYYKQIDTLDELKDYERKLNQYEELIGSEDGIKMYKNYLKEQKEKIEILKQKLSNRALVVVSDNIISRMFRKIKQIILGLVVPN